MSAQQLRLGQAYQRVDLIDRDRPVLAAEKGAKQLRALFHEEEDREGASEGGESEGVEVHQQALFV